MGRELHEAARGFATSVEEYERGRPGYPREAVRFLTERLRLGPGTTVLDLAAGTGKLTRELARTGARVVAVEPLTAMREVLVARQPDVSALAGTAEEIPLPDGAVAAVTVGQAFHWFDGERALAEIHRVLRPAGRLGLIWNRRDDAQPLQARLTELVEPHRGSAPGHASRAWRRAFARTTLFTPLAERRFRHDHETDADGLAARVASISFVAALPPEERAHVLAQVRSLVEPGTPVVLRHRTEVFWCERRSPK
jgi:SAM-dependent methyltransferase